MMKLADTIVLTKETVRACAKRHGMRAVFGPKVYAGEAGNGMHIHMSLTNKGEKSNTFSGSAPLTISDQGKSFVEGIVTHLPALISIIMPSPSSYARV